MENPIYIFLIVAAAIIAAAILLTRLFGNQIRREKHLEDPNADPKDGDGIATWTGIDPPADGR